jgi:hypothetical protein
MRVNFSSAFPRGRGGAKRGVESGPRIGPGGGRFLFWEMDGAAELRGLSVAATGSHKDGHAQSAHSRRSAAHCRNIAKLPEAGRNGRSN